MIQSIAISALVVIMMTTIGLELTLEDLGTGLRKGWTLGLALLANIVLVPALAYGLGTLAGFPAGLLVGMMVCACAPGGPTGPLFSRIANADLGFATALQVLLCVIGLVTAPLTLGLFIADSGAGSASASATGAGSLILPMVRTLLIFQLLPLAAGMAFRRARPDWAERLVKPVGMVANALLLVVIIGMLAVRGSLLLEQPLLVHGLIIVLVLIPLGLVLVAFSGERRRTPVAAAMVTTVRNLSVALLLSASFFDDPMVDTAILVWGFYMMLLPALIAVFLGRGSRDPAQNEGPLAAAE